jgi:hypothetical protein
LFTIPRVIKRQELSLKIPSFISEKMGLDIVPVGDGWRGADIFSGPYSRFERFRVTAAEKLGLELVGPGAHLFPGADHTRIAAALAAVRDTPGGLELFYHSDCDGRWSAEECARILGLLRRVPRPRRAFVRAREKLTKNVRRRAMRTPLGRVLRRRPLEEEFEADLDCFVEGLEYCVDAGVGAEFC